MGTKLLSESPWSTESFERLDVGSDRWFISVSDYQKDIFGVSQRVDLCAGISGRKPVAHIQHTLELLRA